MKPHSEPTSRTGSTRRSRLAALSLAALGVVYGDIGTSPLYTLKEVFGPHAGVPLDAPHVIGVVSTIVWALILVVTIKYVVLILRADYHGEGGILALATLASHAAGKRADLRRLLLLIGVAGATLFYGDSIITPAISVIGAMEGLTVVAPSLDHFVVPASLAVLVALFLIQRFGTATVGKAFGPIILLWFVALAIAGVHQVIQQPAILAALNPVHAWTFLAGRGWHVFAAVGAVVLALTGAEALYADLGHFGRRPIQLAWTGLVLPSLALNYMGQGALLIADPGSVDNPFFRMFPAPFGLPILVLATLAAIIASQAVISGAYSMTRQAIQLGFLPRMAIRYTSAREAGQIYMPGVNFALMLGVVAVVEFFRTSSALAGAYGIAVTLTMLVTSFLAFFVMKKHWRLGLLPSAAIAGFFMALDAFMVGGCLLKVVDGGWLPLGLGLGLFTIMSTWSTGRALLLAASPEQGQDLSTFLQKLPDTRYPRVDGTAVYLVAKPNRVPQALISNLRHNKVLHDRNVILHLRFHEQPWIGMEKRVELRQLGGAFWQVTLNFGFMNRADVPKALALCNRQGLTFEGTDVTYFLSRLSAVATPGEGMALWRERLFAYMTRRASNAAEFFCLPDDDVVQLNTRVPI